MIHQSVRCDDVIGNDIADSIIDIIRINYGYLGTNFVINVRLGRRRAVVHRSTAICVKRKRIQFKELNENTTRWEILINTKRYRYLI